MGRRRSDDRELEAALANALTAGITEGERRAYERVLLAAASEVLGSEARDIEGFVREVGAKDALPLITEAAAEVWPGRYREVLTPVLSAVMAAKTLPNAPLLGSFTLANPRIRAAFEDYVGPLASGLSETSRANAYRIIEEGLEEGFATPKIAEQLRQSLPELNANRATVIARTETLNASRRATDIQVRESEVPIKYKVWKTAGDGRVRPEHVALDGMRVGMDEEFPGEGLVPSSVNCRCTLLYEVDIEAIAGGAA